MTSIVFPGQGSQFVGMGEDFYNEFHEVREIFEIVENQTKIDIKEIIFKNNSNLLDITQFTQLAIFTTSISIYSVFKKYKNLKKLNLNYLLGHSLGEYTALVASNVINIEKCSELLKIRGELMHNSYEQNKSGMLAIIGLDCSAVEKIINENNLNIQIANDNSPLQVVVSGIKEFLAQSEPILIKNGAKKIVHLNVSAAFHSNLMKDAENKMLNYLSSINFKDPEHKIISNFSGKDSKDSQTIFHNLRNQMSNRVRWVESIKCLDYNKENTIIEIGPGKVLSSLIKRISNNFTVSNINSINDLDNFL